MMTDQETIIAVAKLDGLYLSHCQNLHCPHGLDIRNQSNWIKLPLYLTSRDAIVPVIAKCVLHSDQQTQINNTTRFNYALTDVLHAENPHALEQYGWSWVEVILATPRQLCIALLKATGGYKE